MEKKAVFSDSHGGGNRDVVTLCTITSNTAVANPDTSLETSASGLGAELLGLQRRRDGKGAGAQRGSRKSLSSLAVQPGVGYRLRKPGLRERRVK